MHRSLDMLARMFTVVRHKLPFVSYWLRPEVAFCLVYIMLFFPKIGVILLHYRVNSPQYPAFIHPLTFNALLNQRKISGTPFAYSI